jgi:hypothetical protein
MGQSKGGGYQKLPTQNAQQQSTLQQLLGISGQNLQSGSNIGENPLYQQALQAIQGFLPGGQGFAPIQAEANRNFQQNTIPQIVSALGSNNRGSSALNQALASAGMNLNSSLGAQQAQMQLGAAGQGIGASQVPFQQGIQGAQLGLSQQPFAYAPRQTPFWQQALLGAIGLGGQLGGAALGKPVFPGFNQSQGSSPASAQSAPVAFNPTAPTSQPLPSPTASHYSEMLTPWQNSFIR